MARWADVATDAPELAAAGEKLLRAFTLAYLATVRYDGGPRVHPVTVTVHDGALYIFVVERTPKLRDLLRDGRYALHTFPSLPRRTLDSYVDDELVITGRAVVVDDADRRAAVVAVHNDTVHETDVLFELDVESAQHKSRAKGRPVYRRWTG